MDGANCLLLDEPTNQLDIAAKEAVEAALETFDGTVLLVTHDRYLVNEVAERIWAVEGGTLVNYAGNYDFYLEERDKRRERESMTSQPEPKKKEKAPDKIPEKAPEPVKKQAPKGEKQPEVPKKRYTPAEAEKMLPDVELKIREYEALQKVLSTQIADPENQADLSKSRELAKEYEDQQKILDDLMDKWEALMEALE
jgi:ATP-binding cassette subfamily F protein 3